jgi:hypothetical protein
VKLGVVNVEDMLLGIDMANFQSEQLAPTQATTVEQNQGQANGC